MQLKSVHYLNLKKTAHYCIAQELPFVGVVRSLVWPNRYQRPRST